MKTATEYSASTIERTLLDLVAIPSVSSSSNAPVIDYVAGRLAKSPWQIRRHVYHDERGVQKINAIVSPSRQSKNVELALVCHTDTVPFDPAWAHAVHPVINKGRIYGRGSCDIKGFLACALTALIETDPGQLNKPLALILTADEEIGCIGAKRLANEKRIRPRFAIVGEPTGLSPVFAGKGYALAEVVVRGKEAHSAFPAEGRSAIYDAARIVQQIEKIARQVARKRHPAFDPPFTTLNVGIIQGGTAKNVVPGECRILLEWRPVPGQNAKWVTELVGAAVESLGKKQISAKVEIQRLDDGFETPADSVLLKTLEDLSGRSASTVAYGTEAPYLLQCGAETVVIGAGDMRVAHRTGENVPIKELKECTNILRQTILKFCG
jgi:acetylornithine deacetylase